MRGCGCLFRVTSLEFVSGALALKSPLYSGPVVGYMSRTLIFFF